MRQLYLTYIVHVRVGIRVCVYVCMYVCVCMCIFFGYFFGVVVVVVENIDIDKCVWSIINNNNSICNFRITYITSIRVQHTNIELMCMCFVYTCVYMYVCVPACMRVRMCVCYTLDIQYTHTLTYMLL